MIDQSYGVPQDIEAKLVASDQPGIFQRLLGFVGIGNDLNQKIYQFME